MEHFEISAPRRQVINPDPTRFRPVKAQAVRNVVRTEQAFVGRALVIVASSYVCGCPGCVDRPRRKAEPARTLLIPVSGSLFRFRLTGTAGRATAHVMHEAIRKERA